ncbi:hypothetical protein AB4305_25770 [Nocardia sp. 2YAB30]|uniref:hypothetical protein n=1 Tax=unclassified Nocardia TaxID=2637762 RepID=UPI003F98F60D
MATSGSGRGPDDDRGGDSSRILPNAALIAAVLALVVGILVLLQPTGDSADDKPPHSAAATATRTRAWPYAKSLQTPTPPELVPLRPAREVGGDCSAGGISAYWDMRDGQWTCVPRNAHQIGDDCSHSGVVAHWDLTPDRQWVCVQQQQLGLEPPPTTPGGF